MCNPMRVTCIAQCLLALAVSWQECLPQAEKGPAGVIVQQQRVVERPRRWAILIGVNQYEDEQGIGSLKCCVADMNLLYEVLTGPNGGFQRENVLLMTDEAESVMHRPTYSNMVTMIPRWLADVKPEDDVLLAFSGHGIEEDGQCYLLPGSAKRGALRLTSVSVPQVQEWLASCRAKRKVLILDACHSGAGKAPGKMSAVMKQELETGHGFLRLASCDAGQKSNESPALGHGVFTYYLAKALQGRGDFDRDGRVGVHEAYRYVSREVCRWARQQGLRQDPLMSGRISGGQLTVSYVPSRRKQEPGRASPTETAALFLKIQPADTEVFIDGDPLELKQRGRVVFTKVSPGRHILEVRKDGHVQLEHVLDVPAGGVEAAVKLALLLQRVTVYLKSGRTIEGTLLSRAGGKITLTRASARGKMTLSEGMYEKVELGKRVPAGESTIEIVTKATGEKREQAIASLPPRPTPQASTKRQDTTDKPGASHAALPKAFTNPTDGSEMILVPAGTFKMGSNDGQDDEKPLHDVRVDAFYLGKYEVTKRQFSKFLQANPQWRKDRIDSKYHDGDYLKGWSGDKCPADKADHPVARVSWFAAKAYCEWAGGRLPTEAEWEYACRAGSTTKYCFGDSNGQLGHYAWYRKNSGPGTRPVGQKKRNKWGIYDMHGNVWEWCSSKYQPYPYKADDGREDLNDPGSSRVLRGGSWNSTVSICRAACRGDCGPSACPGRKGLRFCVSARAPR